MKYPVTLFILSVTLLFAQQQQFTSPHQQEWEFYRDHPEMVGSAVAEPALSKRSDLMGANTLNTIVYGFQPYWQNGSETNYYFSLLTHLAYFSADVNPATGGFSSTHSWSSANAVTLAKQYGKKVHLTLVLFSDHATLLNSTTNKNALIQNTLAQLAVRNADGVNIDFESMSETVRVQFRDFMKQFGDTLKAHGYEFVIELPAVDWSTGSDGIGIFDATFYSTVNPVVNQYFVMLYAYWYSGSATAGPNAPLQSSSVTSSWHVLRSINTILARGCPANKLIAGFPNYGNDWPVVSNARMAATTGTGSSRTYTVVKNNYIDTIAAENKFFDATYNSPWYRYQSGGTWRQTWYEDSLSWARKFDSIKTKNLAGTGMWALGYDGTEPELWGALKTAFTSSANPAFTSLDNFENGAGHFNTVPSFSGTTVGISAASTSAYTNDDANNGSGSLQVVLKDHTSSSSDWVVRLLSGSGTVGNNISFSTAGYLGFWMKTSIAPAYAEVALSVDDGAGGTLISAKQNVVNDGAWHLYEWNLAATQWTILAGSDSLLNGPTATLDAIMFYAQNGSPDWSFFMDDVSHNPSGPMPIVPRREKNIPAEFVLEQNFPNPFNPSTEIRYQISEVSRVSLKVYDVLGKEIATLVDEEIGAGRHSVQFDASHFSSGVYFYSLRAGNFSATKKLLLMK